MDLFWSFWSWNWVGIDRCIFQFCYSNFGSFFVPCCHEMSWELTNWRFNLRLAHSLPFFGWYFGRLRCRFEIDPFHCQLDVTKNWGLNLGWIFVRNRSILFQFFVWTFWSIWLADQFTSHFFGDLVWNWRIGLQFHSGHKTHPIISNFWFPFSFNVILKLTNSISNFGRISVDQFVSPFFGDSVSNRLIHSNAEILAKLVQFLAVQIEIGQFFSNISLTSPEIS